jgi:hypothetical protein
MFRQRDDDPQTERLRIAAVRSFYTNIALLIAAVIATPLLTRSVC